MEDPKDRNRYRPADQLGDDEARGQAGAIPANELKNIPAIAGLAKLVELANQYAAPMYAPTAAGAADAPHGIGHLVGLGVRDPGLASYESRNPAPRLPRLRVDIPLQPRQTGTVEPGIYFVLALLARERGVDGVDWDRVDQLRGLGGVRLEQNVLITEQGAARASPPQSPSQSHCREPRARIPRGGGIAVATSPRLAGRAFPHLAGYARCAHECSPASSQS